MAVTRFLRFWLPVALAWTAVAPFCLRAVSDTDTGWHLAQGRLIATGQFPHDNALAWTAQHHAWFPTSWLYDLIAYAATEHGGVLGLQLLTFAFTALALLLIAAVVAAWLSLRTRGIDLAQMSAADVEAMVQGWAPWTRPSTTRASKVATATVGSSRHSPLRRSKLCL